ncbi:MAG: MT-A70 family methyltransferase [Gaiellaceae bacterium]
MSADRTPAALAGECLVPLGQLREHPQAALVPSMTDEEYLAFLANLRERGVLVPLEVTGEGVVLDGHHRLRAARELQLFELPVRVVAVEDELEHMLLSALCRRNLSGSRAAALAVRLGSYREEKEKARERSQGNLRRGPEWAPVPTRGERPRALAASVAGVGERTVEDAACVYEEDPELFAQVETGQVSAKRAAMLVRRRRRDAELFSPPFPSGLFQIIYADPPWRSQSPDSDWAPEAHYPTMTIEEICALPVPAADDALLFLWVTNALLLQVHVVMEAWGFEYRTNVVWVKPSIRLGQWVRNRHELLLLGRKGSFPLPAEADRPKSVIEAECGRHSEKPVAAYELIERAYPRASKLELFARGVPRDGWTAWGNEVEAA